MKIFRLLMNEFAKIFRRRGLMTVFILIVLNSFLAGLGVYDSSSYSGAELFLENELEDYRRLVKTYTDQIADYESMLPPADESADTVSDMSEDASQDTEQESTFYKSLNELRFSLLEAETYVSVYERALELSITSADDWRYSVLYDIINGETKIACYKEILGADEDDEDYIATVICTYLEISSNYTAAEIRAKLAVQKDNLDSLWESVETGDYGAYCKNEITALQYEQAAKQSELEMINRQLEDNPSSIELSLSKRKAEGAKGAVEGKIEIQKYRYQNGIEFKSWVDRTLDLMLEKYDSYISLLNSFVTEEYFHKNGDYYEWTYADYGEYSALMNSDLQSCLDSVSIGWYSIENGVEELSVADSTRENMLGFSDMFLFFSFFAIVVAGISVSGEYITRTIYLLLIRPAKRYKILLSKYLSAAVAVMSLIALSFGGVSACKRAYSRQRGPFASVHVRIQRCRYRDQLFILDGFPRALLHRLGHVPDDYRLYGVGAVQEYRVFDCSRAVYLFFVHAACLYIPQQHALRIPALPLFQHLIVRIQRHVHACFQRDAGHLRFDCGISRDGTRMAGRAYGDMSADSFCFIYAKGCDEHLMKEAVYANEALTLSPRAFFSKDTRGRAGSGCSLPCQDGFHARPRQDNPFQVVQKAYAQDAGFSCAGGATITARG